MYCFIPIATGQTVPDRVIDSINDATVLIVDSEGEINSQSKNTAARLSGEPRSRNKCVEVFNEIDAWGYEEFVAMQDRDCLHLINDGFQRAINYLEQHPDLDAVALPWRDRFEPDAHVRMLCVVFRAHVFSGLVFRRERRKCCCTCLAEDISIEYLPADSKMICEINTQT